MRHGGLLGSFDNKNVGTAKPVTASSLTKTGADAGNYTFTGSGTGTADITALALTATVDANSRAYNGNAIATINSCTFTNAIALDDVSCVTTGYSATFDNKNVGIAKPVTATGLTKTGADAGNYTFTGTGTGTANITAIALTATVDANSRAYNGNATATINSCSFAGVVGSEDVTCVITGYAASFDNKNVGTAKPVTATGLSKTGADAGNYTFTGSGTGAADITAVALTATVDANSRAYNGNATATINSCAFTNAIALDDVSCVITGYTASFDNKNIGTGKPVTATGLSKTGTDAGNYTFTGSGTGAADITAVALTATVDANSRAYNGNATATINSCSFAGVVGSEDVTCGTTGYAASFNNKNVGTTKPVTATGLTMSGVDAGNYTFTGTGTGTADITAIALTATVDANSRAYSGNATAMINSCAFTNAIALDDILCVTTGYAASFDNKNVGIGKPVTATGLTKSGADAGNYTFTGTGTGTADITAVALTATVDANSKAYNGNATATINSCAFNNAIALDDVACVTTGYTAFFNNKNVGTAKTVTATGLTKSGADAGNYTFTGTGTGTADITAIALTATVDANSRAYNGNATATISSCSFSGVQGTDDVTCVTTGYVASFDNKNVGTAKPVTATGLTKTGTDAGNYTFTGTGTGTADITAQALTATVDANNKPYDGNTTATINSCSFTNAVALDDVICVITGYSATFDDANIGTGKTVTATGLTKSGADAGNYTFTGVGTGLASITSGTVNGTILYYNGTNNYVPDVTVNGAGGILVSGITNASGSYSITGFGSGSYTMTPTRAMQLCDTQNGVLIDDAALVSEYVVGLTTLSATQKLAAKVSGTATANLSSFDAALIAQKSVGICDSPNIAGKWGFAPGTYTHNPVTTHTDNYTAYLMGDVTGDWSSTAVPNIANRETSSPNAVRASLPAGNAQPGTEVTVPFRIDNLNGRSLNSYQFSVVYDPAVIVPADESANVDGTLSGNLNAVYNTPTPGLLRVGVYGAFPTQGDGVYVNLKFRVIGSNGSSSPLTINGFRFNRGTDEVTSVHGRITVGIASAEATLQGRVLAMGGRGVTGARVTATSAAGVVKTGFTTRYGQFIISGLTIGETYTVAVQSRRFVFAPRSVPISDSMTNVDFVAEQ